jgi:hypothetical protein
MGSNSRLGLGLEPRNGDSVSGSLKYSRILSLSLVAFDLPDFLPAPSRLPPLGIDYFSDFQIFKNRRTCLNRKILAGFVQPCS